MSTTLFIATRNEGKTDEFRQLFGPDVSIRNFLDIPGFPDVPETGDTFEENAILKAKALSMEMEDAYVLADDSGLEVDALGGDPGIYSARYAGLEATDADNRAKLLDELKDAYALDAHSRTARFRCVLALACHGSIIRTFTGTCEGQIAFEERGTGGFGYDSIFIPDGHSLTFAELPSAEKNRISHRGRALEKLKVHLKEAPLRSSETGIKTAVDKWISDLAK